MNRNRLSSRLRITGRFMLSLALLSQTVLFGFTPGYAQVRSIRGKTTRNLVDSSKQKDDTISSELIRPVSTTIVNFQELSDKQARKRARKPEPTQYKAAPMPMTIPDSEKETPGDDKAPAPPGGNDIVPGPDVPSPSPSTHFQGEVDQALGGGQVGNFTIPPDTMGAVGLDKVFVNVNNNYKVQNKVTGAQLSLVSIDAFWASTGATSPFDPRVQYDPYNDRWLLSVVSNAQTANSSILVGISNTSDPQGTYTLFRFIVGCANGAPGCAAGGEWADFPMMGSNKNWAAISVNMFSITTNTNNNFKTLVLDYPQLRGGTASGTLFTGAGIGFCNHPALTFSATENTLYLVLHLSSAGATYKLSTITGTPSAPVFTIGVTRVRPGGGWVQPQGELLPQQCIPGVGLPTQVCPPIIRKMDVGDAFIRGNVVFRNGKIFYPQTIGIDIPGGDPIDHTAAQWTVLNNDGTFFDGGRVEDVTATATNGGKWYAYPSISANKNNDILFGFSEFESDGYADAGYTFRLGTDAAGTMRDPLIYKSGEDYYEKDFGAPRNRWGDYSHTVVDPSNDRDLWTIQEYAGLRVGTTGTAVNDSRWATWWAKVTAPAGAGDLLISEFRLSGPSAVNGPVDEYVEIFNNNNSPLTVQTLDGTAGFAIAAQDNVVRCTIPNGTTIPARGHYLCVNSIGYSLSNYPAGNGTTATGDATFTTDIPNNSGVAVFRSATSLTAADRLDAVGFTTTLAPYFEGTGLPVMTTFNLDHAWYRKAQGSGACTGGGTPACPSPTGPGPQDTDNNATDFFYVDTTGTSAGAGIGPRLGAPGPENLSSPIQRNGTIAGVMLDATVGMGNPSATPPNRVRDLTSDPPNNSIFGTLDIRRRFINNTGAVVTRLRFRVVDISTFPPPAGVADLRARTSSLVIVSGINDAATCSPAPTPCAVNVQGTTLEEPPTQPNAGGYNSSLSAGTVTLATPVAPGASINIRFLMGVQQTGRFKVFLNVEALP
ncbi:MAG: hypothetical protein ACREBG_25415 [Pyrinomonadaceae bacterium]